MRKDTFRHLRVAACMTQAHLAKAAEVSVRSIQRLEAGLPVGPETLRAVCAVLGGNASEQSVSDRPRAPFDGNRPVWSDELLDKAVAMWRAGMGGEAIALRLGRGLTRNGVVCKMYRLGLAFEGGVTRGSGSGVADAGFILPSPNPRRPRRGGPPEPAGCPA